MDRIADCLTDYHCLAALFICGSRDLLMISHLLYVNVTREAEQLSRISLPSFLTRLGQFSVISHTVMKECSIIMQHRQCHIK